MEFKEYKQDWTMLPGWDAIGIPYSILKNTETDFFSYI